MAPGVVTIQPSNIWQMAKTLKQWNLCASKPDLPIHEDLTSVPTTRLKSHKPFWLNTKSLLQSGFDAKSEWTKNWQASKVNKKDLIQDPTEEPLGFHLQWRHWTNLNRLRTQHGRTACHLHKWKMIGSPACDCDYSQQSVQHVVNDCA